MSLLRCITIQGLRWPLDRKVKSNSHAACNPTSGVTWIAFILREVFKCRTGGHLCVP
jgi:hypothetical protein